MGCEILAKKVGRSRNENFQLCRIPNSQWNKLIDYLSRRNAIRYIRRNVTRNSLTRRKTYLIRRNVIKCIRKDAIRNNLTGLKNKERVLVVHQQSNHWKDCLTHRGINKIRRRMKKICENGIQIDCKKLVSILVLAVQRELT